MIKIGIDLDGTVSDVCEAIIKNLKWRYNITVTRDEITTYDIRNCLKVNDRETKMFHDPNFYADNEFNRGAKRILAQLYKSGYVIYFVTNRPSGYEMVKTTMRWLSNNDIVYHDIIFTDNKKEVVEQEELQYFVDDRLDIVLELSPYCELVFLYDAPYNQSDILPDNVIRVKDWYEIYDYLELE